MRKGFLITIVLSLFSLKSFSDSRIRNKVISVRLGNEIKEIKCDDIQERGPYIRCSFDKAFKFTSANNISVYVHALTLVTPKVLEQEIDQYWKQLITGDKQNQEVEYPLSNLSEYVFSIKSGFMKRRYGQEVLVGDGALDIWRFESTCDGSIFKLTIDPTQRVQELKIGGKTYKRLISYVNIDPDESFVTSIRTFSRFSRNKKWHEFTEEGKKIPDYTEEQGIAKRQRRQKIEERTNCHL